VQVTNATPLRSSHLQRESRCNVLRRQSQLGFFTHDGSHAQPVTPLFVSQ